MCASISPQPLLTARFARCPSHRCPPRSLPASQVGLLQRYSKSRCIDVLERLNAANVGSGEMGAISVEKVVEILLKEE